MLFCQSMSAGWVLDTLRGGVDIEALSAEFQKKKIVLIRGLATNDVLTLGPPGETFIKLFL